MKADLLLSRLEKVRPTGKAQWLACCPSHQDRSPSLSVRELPDGRILIHCFAGCGVDEVLGSLGLEFDALFPDAPQERVKGLRRPFPASDVLAALADEARVLAMGAAWLNQGIVLNAEGRARMVLAASRIEAGRALANG